MGVRPYAGWFRPEQSAGAQPYAGWFRLEKATGAPGGTGLRRIGGRTRAGSGRRRRRALRVGRGCAESVRPSKSFFQLLPYDYSFFRCCFFFYFCVFHIFCFFDLYYFCFYQFYCSCFYFCVYATVGAAWTAAGPCADRCGNDDETVAPQDRSQLPGRPHTWTQSLDGALEPGCRVAGRTSAAGGCARGHQRSAADSRVRGRSRRRVSRHGTG